MPFNILTAPIGEMPRYPKIVSGPKGPMTYRCVKVLASDVFNWAAYFLANPGDPYAIVWGATAPPLLWEIRIEPFWEQQILDAGAFPGSAHYDWALMFLTYNGESTILHGGSTIIQERISTRIEAERASPVGLTWNSDGKALEWSEAPTYTMPGESYEITYPFSTSAGTSLTPGDINNAPFTSYLLGRTFATGTLRYTGSEIDISVQLTGLQRWRKRFTFHWRPVSWNLFPRPSTWNFEQINKTGGGAFAAYPSVTFTGNV
jgi:hypothetical protein